MKQIRLLHFYLDTFFAPAIFFFSFTGALQTLGLHESEKGSANQPPAWIVVLAGIHKDQRLEAPHKPHLQAAAPANAEAGMEHVQKPDQDEEQSKPLSSVPLKCFVLLLAIGLMASAALGIYVALQSRNNRRITWVMLVSGIAVPVVLLYM